MSIGRILFPAYNILSSDIEAIEAEICLARADWNSDEVRHISIPFQRESSSHGTMVKFVRRIFKTLCVIILALSRIRNIEECREAPLSTNQLPRNKYQTVYLTSVKEAFPMLALLFLGKAPDQQDIDRAAVISHRGWSLCISSINSSDPGDLYSDFALLPGVPSRMGERKDWIMDAATGATWDCDHDLDTAGGKYEIVASETDQVYVKSFLPLSKAKHMIGTTTVSARKAFVVFTTFSCMERIDGPSAYIHLGFRYMQNLFWDRCLTSTCEHSFQTDIKIMVPPNVWVFKGLLGPLGTSGSKGLADILHQYKSKKPLASTEISTDMALTRPLQSSEVYEAVEASSNPSEQSLSSTSVTDQSLALWVAKAGRQIHISQSAKNKSVRWILLGNSQIYLGDSVLSTFTAFYLRHNECCVDCAISFIKKRSKGPLEHVGLIN